MMNELVNRHCEACRVGSPLASEAQIQQYMPLLPQWQIIEESGLKKLTRRYKTKKYSETIRLVNAIAELANAEDHHPVLLVEYGAVTVWWWTHIIQGLHLNDFIMAARTDAIYQKDFDQASAG